MKTFLTKLVGMISILGLFLVFTEPVKAVESITFTFANAQVTHNGADSYYEFDIMVHASANTQFEEAQLYINYNNDAFGTNIYGSGNVTVTGGPLFNPVVVGSQVGGCALSLNDNSPSVFTIANTWGVIGTGAATGYDLSQTLGTTDVQYVHVKIKVQDYTKVAGVSFNESISQWDQQDFYFTSGNNTTNYTPVTETGTLNDSPLPVELNSFNAKVSGSNVELLWKTATEVNNHGFEVERKANDNQSASWEKVGFVNGSGNSNSPKDYSYTDKNITGGSKFSYRLKQIDNSGSYTYSSNVDVEVVPDKFELFQNYPNPFNPSTTIKFSLPEDSRVAINIYNILGEKITELINNDYKAGFYKIQFNPANLSLASGIYFYTIESKNFKDVKKMVLMK